MQPITLVKDAAKCSACGACIAVCPKQAITMACDAYGAQYPVIDETLCIACGKCINACMFHKPMEKCAQVAAYAAAGKNDALIYKSASGGVFASLADSFRHSGGLVAGAVMDLQNSKAEVYHILSNEASDLFRMQGSKYVHSQAWKCYADVLQALKDGKTVLFSGLPCQVAAIKRLARNADRLFTMDLVCHGAPPLQLFNDFLPIIAKRFGGKIQQFAFRDKSCGKDYCARIELGRGGKGHRLYLRAPYLSYYQYFLDCTIFRESCYACPFASVERVSDLTIGDYWGVRQFHDEDIKSGSIPQRKEWSCILVNSQKGEDFLAQYGNDLLLYPTKVDWITQNNRQLRNPSQKSVYREEFLKQYAEFGYSAIEKDFIKKYGGRLRYYRRAVRDLWKNRQTNSISKELEK